MSDYEDEQEIKRLGEMVERLTRQLAEAREALRDTWAWIDSLPAKPLPNTPLGKARAKSMAALGEAKGGGE